MPYFAFFLFFLSAFCPALAGIQVNLYEGKERLNWSTETQPLWTFNKAEDEGTYNLQIKVKTPFTLSAVKGKNSKVKVDGSTLIIESQKLSDTININGSGGKKKIKFLVTPVETPTLFTDCDRFGIGFKPATVGEQPPFYIAIKCSTDKGGSLKVWIATPSEVEWEMTSIAEFAGKGGTVRGFEVSSNISQNVDANLGQFDFNFQTKKYTYALLLHFISLSKKLAIFSVGGGFSSLKTSSADTVASGTKPSLYMKLEQRPLGDKIPVGLEIFSTFAWFEANFMKVTQLLPYMGYSLLDLKGRRQIEPRVAFFISDGYAKAGDSFFSFLFGGMGVSYREPIKSNFFQMDLNLSTSAGNSGTDLTTQFIFTRINEFNQPVYNWSIYLNYNSLKVTSKNTLVINSTSLGLAKFY